MEYQGQNRRVHTCFITNNREYHTRAGVCVAVRDRGSSAWMAAHPSLGLKMKPTPPGVDFLGHPLEFLSRATKIKTSKVVDILRPGRKEVSSYDLVHGFNPVYRHILPAQS